MCIDKETPSKRRYIVGWKFFLNTSGEDLQAFYGVERYKKGILYTAIQGVGDRTYRPGYIGFHGFFTRKEASLWEFKHGTCGTLKKCLFLDIIGVGCDWPDVNIRVFRSRRMLIL